MMHVSRYKILHFRANLQKYQTVPTKIVTLGKVQPWILLHKTINFTFFVGINLSQG